MAVLKAEGIPVVAGMVVLPLVGRASAAIHFGLSKPLFEEKQQITLRWFNGWEIIMSVETPLTSVGEYSALCTAGLGLNNVVQVRYYREAPISVIAQDIIAQAGEVPGEIDAPETLPRFIQRPSPAHKVLQRLTKEGDGLIWNVWDDGKVRVGRIRPEVRGPYRVRAIAGNGLVTLDLALDLKPGNILLGHLDGSIQQFGLVEKVIHSVDGLENELVTMVWVK